MLLAIQFVTTLCDISICKFLRIPTRTKTIPILFLQRTLPLSDLVIVVTNYYLLTFFVVFIVCFQFSPLFWCGAIQMSEDREMWRKFVASEYSIYRIYGPIQTMGHEDGEETPLFIFLFRLWLLLPINLILCICTHTCTVSFNSKRYIIKRKLLSCSYWRNNHWSHRVDTVFNK